MQWSRQIQSPPTKTRNIVFTHQNKQNRDNETRHLTGEARTVKDKKKTKTKNKQTNKQTIWL